MKFVMARDRTIVSTCGLSVAYKKGEPALTPPAMYAEVIAAGGVPEEEIPEGEMPPARPTPDQLAEREKQMLQAFDVIVRRAVREDFTAGGVPHVTVVAAEVGWTVQPKEVKAAWVKYTAGRGE